MVARSPVSGSGAEQGPVQFAGCRPGAWVVAEIITSTGLTFLGLPLFRPERGARSSLMDVSNERARTAGLTLTDPAVAAGDVRA